MSGPARAKGAWTSFRAAGAGLPRTASSVVSGTTPREEGEQFGPDLPISAPGHGVDSGHGGENTASGTRSDRPPNATPRIGDLLVARGVVSEDQVRIALTEQRRGHSREQLGGILVRLGFATEAVIRDVLGGALGFESVDLGRVVVDGGALRLIPEDLARRHRVLALSHHANLLTVAME